VNREYADTGFAIAPALHRRVKIEAATLARCGLIHSKVILGFTTAFSHAANAKSVQLVF
jgi:hypothetical protein